MVGDFNLSNIKWEFDVEQPGQLLSALTNYEIRFLRTCDSLGLQQINSIPNFIQVFLDLVNDNVNDQTGTSTHPWTKDRKLIKLRHFRKRAKQIYQNAPNALK